MLPKYIEKHKYIYNIIMIIIFFETAKQPFRQPEHKVAGKKGGYTMGA